MKKSTKLLFAIGLISSVYSLSARNISASYGDIIEKDFPIVIRKSPIKNDAVEIEEQQIPTNEEHQAETKNFIDSAVDAAAVIRDVVVDTGKAVVPIVGKGLWIVTKETTKGIYELALGFKAALTSENAHMQGEQQEDVEPRNNDEEAITEGMEAAKVHGEKVFEESQLAAEIKQCKEEQKATAATEVKPEEDEEKREAAAQEASNEAPAAKSVAIGVEAIKNHIKEIIDSEDKRNPLTDVKISEALKEKGLTVTSRKVCDYRRELGYGTSRERKQ